MAGDNEWKKMGKTKEDLHFEEENKRALEAFLAKKGLTAHDQGSVNEHTDSGKTGCLLWSRLCSKLGGFIGRLLGGE